MYTLDDILYQKNIIIYGLSTETERVLEDWRGQFSVVGLLDGFKSEGEQFGLPIFDIYDVVKMDNITIIVVARPGSCKAIAKRIGDICRENNIPLFDIRGNDLLIEKKITYSFDGVGGYKKRELYELIQEVETVSFDLFDTLVVRDIVSSGDVIELVDARLRVQGINITDFVKKRISAEKTLSQGHAPKLVDIYKCVLSFDKSTITKITAEELALFEYETERNLLHVRKEMKSIVDFAKNLGKRVYVTSESYYSKNQIQQIIKDFEIDGLNGVIVSCEYDTGKTGELYEKLVELDGTRNIIHIGDDIVADIESSNRHGLQAFHIYSASELLDKLGGLGLIFDDMRLSDRIRVGMFAANIFNDPFQFEEDSKGIHVDDAKDIGYLFLAPMLTDFTKWFGQQVQDKALNNVWFCARDGYLLKKIYEMMWQNVQSEYFLTSRISAIRAGVEDDADIVYVDSMKYSGDLESNLKTRFGIDKELLVKYKEDENNEGLLKYRNAILDVSLIKRENNLKYIESLNIKDGGIAFFDFVAKGTSQMYIQKLVKNKINGLYFLQLEPEFMKDKNLDITPFYKEEEKEYSAIFDNYYILETLLTAPTPSLDEFDINGNPVYTEETRSQKDIECFMRAHEGILSYVSRYLAICPSEEFVINKKIDEFFLYLIHKVEIRDEDFKSLTVEDPFFNRMTDITDVL